MTKKLPFKLENSGGVNWDPREARCGGRNKGGCPLSKGRKLLWWQWQEEEEEEKKNCY